MRAEEIKGLMEAYSKVHETSEVLSEEVIEISDEDLDGVELIEMTFEELEMLSEQGSSTDPRGYGARQARIKGQTQVKTALGKGKGIGLQSASTGAQVTKSGQKAFGTQLGGRQGVVVKGGATGFTGGRGARSNFSAAADTVNVGGQTLYKAKKGKDIVYLQGKGKPELFKPGQKSNTGSGSGTGGTSGAGRGAGSSGAGATGRSSGGSGTGTTPKPTATSAPKPAPAPAKPAGSAMDQWAAANPKLAAAKAERDRTRGTSATTNPLMKDMKSKLPAPSSPSPSTATTGFNLAKKGVNLAAGIDIFDLVKGHLLDEGYAETEENALVMMANMSEEWRETIIMELTGGKGHPGYKAGSKDHGPMEAGHPADSEKRKDKGGTMSMRHGHHLGDMDDEDDDDDDLESVVKQQSRDSREATRKPLRKLVKAARKKMMTKESTEQLDEVSKTDDGTRARIKMFAGKKGIEFEPGPRWDPSANRGKGANLSPKQMEKQRRKKLRQEDLQSWVDELIAEGYDLSGYSWEEVAEIYAQELELSEAQRARENPEGHDKEEKKKYEPVRGEKTPMPPRGDKRREDFEKWYRANVR
jgi:hypothetical protein